MAYCIIHTTVDTPALAQTITQALLKKRLAACIQHLNIQSHYLWKKELEMAEEILLQIKTRTELFKSVEEMILSLHTYETPEILMYPITKGNQAYLQWIETETKETI